MSVPPAGSRLSSTWRASSAHVRALLVAVVLLGLGVFMRRPDAVALATPLTIVGVWSLLTRPDVAPTVHGWLRHPVLREGQTTAWTMTVEPGPGVEDVAMAVVETPHTRYSPASQALATGEVREHTELDVRCQSLRWGLRSYGPMTCAVSSAFAAYAWQPARVHAPPVPTVPLPQAFSARTDIPDPNGFVGRGRARRHGDGSELADVRAFRFGDRLRRIHWPVSVRTGELHVTTTHADEDSEILLVVDAMHDLGASTDGGDSTSLDNGVRAAAAVAEHYLRVGDRVGLLVLGARESPRVRPGLGSNQLRRLLDVLARVRVADSGVVDEKRLQHQLRHPVSAGTLVVILTPAVSRTVLAHASRLSQRGIAVIVVDTLPAGMAVPRPTDEHLRGLVPDEDELTDGARLAWRIRLLERDGELARARQAGVPIVPWVGPGTLDQVLQALGRRRRAPRMVAR